MKRITLDTAVPAVQKFFRGLAIDSNGVEVTLAGETLCKVIPALQLTEAQKKALIEERWRLIRRSRERNKGLSARRIAREVGKAVAEVRRSQR